jgi:hypothetical protein
MEHPTYDGSPEVDIFLTSMEEKIMTDQRISFLDLAFQDIPAIWWATHINLIMEWEDGKKAIRCRFQSRDQLVEILCNCKEYPYPLLWIGKILNVICKLRSHPPGKLKWF